MYDSTFSSPCLRAAREKHRFAAGKKHRNGKKHVWQQEKNALQRKKAASAAGKNVSKKSRFAAGKIQSSKKKHLAAAKKHLCSRKNAFWRQREKTARGGKKRVRGKKKPAEAGKKPAAEKVQLCNPKSRRNGKNTFPQREKAAAQLVLALSATVQCCSCFSFILSCNMLEPMSAFFPSNAFMAFARSLHTFNCSKKMNCELCKAVYTSIASKALVMDQYTVQ